MKLAKKIATDPWFTRSINLTRDINSEDSIDAYIATSTTKTTLESISKGFENSKYPRAWTLIGPYGSGKSSFGLFLNALASENKPMQSKAFDRLSDFDQTLSENVTNHFKKKKIFRIVLSGSYDLFENHLVEALSKAVYQLEDSEKISSKLKTNTEDLAKKTDPNASEIIALIEMLQDELETLSYKGIFITVDELGKFIEFAGAKKKDIFLLQQLAELTVNDKPVPLFFIGMLHQSMDYYAQNLSLEIKNEWKKIQGRFEEVAFVESSEQMIRILGGAINSSLNQTDKSKIRAGIKDCVYYFLSSKVFPNLSGKRPSLELFEQAYPLHPSSAAILPILAQKLGQNERTVFTYLGSKESFGFQELIQNRESLDFIMPNDIFDYFYTNQSSYINDHVVNKRWIEILNALDRLNDDDENLVNLLKTIGLLNLVGSFSSISCTKELLEKIFPKKPISNMLKKLEKKSLIIFRKFNEEYRIWQGSDFDFESAVRFELDQLHIFDLTNELNSILPARPLLGRKYSIESGTLRFFDAEYASSSYFTKNTDLSNSSNPKALIFFEDGNKVSEKNLKDFQKDNQNTLIIKVLDHATIVNEAKQLKALNNLVADSDELTSDPIARKEVISQIDESKKKIENELKQIFLPQSSKWFWRGKSIQFSGENDLQKHLSNMLKSVFSKSPIINNELINKDFISSQGQAARVRLMKDMLEKRNCFELNYPADKAPPEKGMFKAIFLDNDLASSDQNGTSFHNPNKNTDFYEVYELIKKILSQSDKPLMFTELSDVLRAPPYGIKKGIHAVIFLAFYLSNEENIAIYEDSLYKPYFNSEAIERLARKSPSFSFKFHSFEGQNKIIEEYANILSKNPDEKNVLTIVKKLSKTMSILPEYTLSTQSALSEEAKKFRSAFLYSKSPLDLLMKDIPHALGFSEKDLSNAKSLDDFASHLNKVLSELKGCYVSLILNQKKNFCFAFDLDGKRDFVELRPELYDRLIMLEDYAIDTKSIKPFLRKLLDRQSQDQDWFESILSFLIKKHPKKWTDENASEAEVELKNISDKIKGLLKLRVYESSNKIDSAHDLDIFVMRIKKKGFEEKDVITTLTKNERDNYDKFKKEILQILFKYSKDSEDHLSLLSPLVDDILNGNVSKRDILKIVKDKK